MTYAITVGANTVTGDTIDARINQAITKKASSFRLLLDNRGNKWSALAPLDVVAISLSGTNILHGRVDTPSRKKSKSTGDVLELTGRDDFGALMDVEANRHERLLPSELGGTRSVYDIANAIVSQDYANNKGASDPAITINAGSNALPVSPDTMLYSANWKAKRCQSMLLDLIRACATPAEFGGVGLFYDLYVTYGQVCTINEAGTQSSGVNLDSADSEIEFTHPVDSLPIKTDIWVMGDSLSGRIPLQMQFGYGQASYSTTRTDPWTELNGSDYKAGPNCIVLGDSGAIKYIGDYAIGAAFEIPEEAGDPTTYGYFYMRFPFPDDGSKWPSQDPAGGLNTYNMTRLHETMGEISAIGFFIYNSDTEVRDFRLEAVDGQDEPVTIATKKLTLPVATWAFYQKPFGPSVSPERQADEDQYPEGGWAISDVDGDPPEDHPDAVFDWTNVAEIRWKVFAEGTVEAPAGPGLIMDGLQFGKPLVANYKSGSTARTYVDLKNELTHWWYAQAWVKGLWEEMSKYQQYYKIQTVGRVDIPIAYTFTFDSKTLQAREIDYHLSKDSGFTVEYAGYEAT